MIRDFREEDAAGVVALLREVDPTHVVTAEAVVHRHRSTPPRAQLRIWVAEEAGRLVAQGRAYLPWDTSSSTVGELGIDVAPDARRRGLGGELYDRAVSHLRRVGARTAGAWAEPESVPFLERRQHEVRRSSQKSALVLDDADLTELDELAASKASEGFRVVSMRDVMNRPREVFELDVATVLDEPSDYPIDTMDYDEWLRTTYEQPTLDWEGSRVVLAGDLLVAWALIETDGDRRAVNAFTGTRPEFRGRGLARLAKLAVAAWAREHGIGVLYTGNDAANAPMLAINRRLGYRPVAERHYAVRQL